MSLTNSGLSSDLIRVLKQAAPIYQSHWWSKQDQANRRWIANVKPLVRSYGDALRGEISRAYGASWPPLAVRVDVVTYANWAGAYTTLRPVHIIMSSADPSNQGEAALEVLFHEASHALIGKLRRKISAQCRIQRKRMPTSDLWHAIIFYTTGHLVKELIPDYTPYAISHGLWVHSWAAYERALRRDWEPYLEGRISSQEAIQKLVSDVGLPASSAH